jgi:hypothetical protein
MLKMVRAKPQDMGCAGLVSSIASGFAGIDAFSRKVVGGRVAGAATLIAAMARQTGR